MVIWPDESKRMKVSNFIIFWMQDVTKVKPKKSKGKKKATSDSFKIITSLTKEDSVIQGLPILTALII